MRILGIDPGYGRVGWGVITDTKGNPTVQGYGTIETGKASLEIRLGEIYEEVNKIIATYLPEEFAVEELFFSTNAKTVIPVAEARGVILLAGKNAGLSFHEYTPLEVKMAIAGYGRAEKKQLADLVKKLLHLEHMPKVDDTTDALAVALTHAYSRKMKNL